MAKVKLGKKFYPPKFPIEISSKKKLFGGWLIEKEEEQFYCGYLVGSLVEREERFEISEQDFRKAWNEEYELKDLRKKYDQT